MTDNQNKKMTFSFVEQEKHEAQEAVETKISGKSYISYGQNNDFPQYIWSLYLRSAILQSIINGTCDYIAGNGFYNLNIPNQFKDTVNKDGDTLDDIIRLTVKDYIIFGGFALQLIDSVGGGLAEIYYVDIQNIRIDEEEKKAFYSRKWGKYNNKTITYNLFSPNKQQKNCIFYFKGHLTRGIYPIPMYVGALNAVETSAEIGKYHLNNITNNLDSGTIISFNNGIPSLSEQKEIEKQINRKFAGTGNAGRTMVTFSDNKDTAPTINKLGEDGKDTKFDVLYKNTMKEIFVAFRATPTLFGLQVENNGFSKEEFMQAFELYNKTVIRPLQRDIEKCFDKIFGQHTFELKSFTLDEADTNKLTME